MELHLSAAVAFSHAVVAYLAAERGIRVLHVKGPTLEPMRAAAAARTDEATQVPSRISVDADVWVDPAQAAALREALLECGWRLYSDFWEGSSHEHAATLTTPGLASVDMHRTFPGIGVAPEVAFARLWRERGQQQIAGVDCWVPSPSAQRLILLLNSARGGTSRRDLSVSWEHADEQERQEVRRLAHELDAEVPMAAAIGELDRWRHRSEHDMWQYLSTGTGTPTQRWWARVKAEGGLRAGLRRGFLLIFPTPHRMSLAAGRELSRRELLAAYGRRISPAVRSMRGKIAQRLRGGKS